MSSPSQQGQPTTFPDVCGAPGRGCSARCRCGERCGDGVPRPPARRAARDRRQRAPRGAGPRGVAAGGAGAPRAPAAEAKRRARRPGHRARGARASSRRGPACDRARMGRRRRAAPALDGGSRGVEVAFTSRAGGVSSGPFRSLNLGALTADDAANVAENRRRAVTAAGGDGPRRRWHGRCTARTCARSERAGAGGRFLEPGVEPFPKSDGLATRSPARPLCCSRPTACRSRSRAPTGAAWRCFTPAGGGSWPGRGGGRRRPSAARCRPRSGRARGRAATRWATTSATRCGAGSATTSSATGRPTCGWRRGGRSRAPASPTSRSRASARSAAERFFSHRRDRRRPAARGSSGCSVSTRAVIASNLRRVRAPRPAPDVEILAATKYVEADDLAALRDGGVTLVGENRADALLAKQERFGDRVHLGLHRPRPEPQGARPDRPGAADPRARLD